MQILFLGLLAGCQITFIPAIQSYVSLLQVVAALLLSACPYYFTYKCVSSTASYITNLNHHEHLRLYPFDYVLFKPGKLCPSCLFLKPARSKHCSICQKCVAKQDHHCVWIMNCVGKGNYGYFIALLFSLSVMLTYGAYLGYYILDTVLQRISARASGNYARHHWSTGQTWSQYSSMWAYGLALDNRVGGIGLLAMFTAPMAWGFFAYHMYLIWAGMTTNESSKWEDWKYMISLGTVFKSENPSSEIMDSTRNEEYEPHAAWPASSQQVIEICEDGNMPQVSHGYKMKKSDAQGLESAPRWKEVEGLHQVENLYDLGFWDNLRDVLPSRVATLPNEQSVGRSRSHEIAVSY